MAEAKDGPAPAPDPADDWIAPPVGGEAKRYDPKSEPLDPREMDMVVDRITTGIRQIWHAAAVWMNDPVWEHSEQEMWGYSVVVGVLVKKFAKNSEYILLAVGIMAILVVETMKFMDYAKRHRKVSGPVAAVPAGAA
jgi:hypothetical protein